MLTLLLTIIIWGIIFYVAWWALGQIGLPEPFNKVAVVILVLAVLFVLVGIFTGSVAPFHLPSSL